MIDKYERAGKIVFDALQLAKSEAKPGAKLLELAEKIEGFIVSQGARPAFPANISINDTAAHYTPPFDDAGVLGEKDVVKIDVGAHVDGFIGDIAATIDFSGENGKLVEASESALQAALSVMRAGAHTSAVGEAVETEIKKYGFKPIENLTGHALGEYELHAGIEIPSIRTQHSHELKEGDVFAVEPFASAGAGHVSEGNLVEIFSLLEQAPARLRESRKLLSHAQENYKKLPFAERWLRKAAFPSKLLLNAALKELVLAGALRQYPVLRDSGKGLVSQAELTVRVEKDSVSILTR
ncbi:MAG: type II methionyl aminopeptidase [Candidatus Micrarchaeota archaeon]